jgi:hypothetical protein
MTSRPVTPFSSGMAVTTNCVALNVPGFVPHGLTDFVSEQAMLKDRGRRGSHRSHRATAPSNFGLQPTGLVSS